MYCVENKSFGDTQEGLSDERSHFDSHELVRESRVPVQAPRTAPHGYCLGGLVQVVLVSKRLHLDSKAAP